MRWRSRWPRVLIASPLAIADVGLWLTFGATAAIVAGAALSDAAARQPWLQGAGGAGARVAVRRDRADARSARSCFSA